MREDIIHFHTPQMKTPFYLEMAGISYCDGSYKITRLDSRENMPFSFLRKGHVSLVSIIRIEFYS